IEPAAPRSSRPRKPKPLAICGRALSHSGRKGGRAASFEQIPLTQQTIPDHVQERTRPRSLLQILVGYEPELARELSNRRADSRQFGLPVAEITRKQRQPDSGLGRHKM